VSQYPIKLCPTGAQTCALPLFCDHDLEINRMTLKLESELDIPNLHLRTENEAVSLRHSKFRAQIEKKYENMSQGQRSRSTCQKLLITSSIIVTDIPIKPQQFPISGF